MKPQEGGFALDGAGGLEQALALGRIGPASLDVGEEPARALHAQQIDQLEACLAHLRLQLLRTMEEGGGEVVLVRGIPVLSVAEVARDDGGEVGIAEHVLEDAGLALAASVGAMGLFGYMLRSRTAGVVSSNFYVIPGLTAVLAWVVLGETLSATAAAGFVLSSVGVWLAQREAPAP